jgi:spore coat protein H
VNDRVQTIGRQWSPVRARREVATVVLVACLGALACSSRPETTPPFTVGSPMSCGTDAGCACAASRAAGCMQDPPTSSTEPAGGSSGNPDGATGDGAAGNGATNTLDGSSATDASIQPPDPTGPGSVMADPMDDAAYIYDPAVVHTFDVEVAAADLDLADSSPMAEQYVSARLRFEGTTYEVGYRYKGSLGAFYPPCTGFDGRKAGKCSVKLSFNWTDPEGRFFGLKKLLFHSMNNDPSMMRERLGYGLFREMGVPSPRATHAILRVNGQADLYALVEEIDGRFTRSRFTEGGEGNLYKEIWPIHDDPQAYLAALETNEDSMPSAERILRFKDAVRQGADAMATWMDVDVTASYMAVDRVTMNDDGAFSFYCFANAIGNNPVPPGNHNYYWYEAENTDRLWIIPWDLDLSMIGTLAPPHVDVDWRTTPSAEQCDVCGTLGALGPAPGCDPVIRNFQTWLPSYEAKVDAFIAGPFSKQAVDDKLERWTQQLLAAGYPVQQIAVDELEATLDAARTNRGFPY